MGRDQLIKTCRDIGKFIAEEVINPLLKRIETLEAKSVEFAGTWKANQSYAERALVSFRGGLWLSKMPNNTTRPGEGPAWWLMCEIRRCSEMNDDDLEHLLDLADAYYARRGYSEDAAKKLLDEVRQHLRMTLGHPSSSASTGSSSKLLTQALQLSA
jgi:hypothetical protein